MKYSIIIAVYNRLEEVKELLESAEKLEGNRCLFELLFVDDGQGIHRTIPLCQWTSNTSDIPTKSRSRGCQKLRHE